MRLLLCLLALAIPSLALASHGQINQLSVPFSGVAVDTGAAADLVTLTVPAQAARYIIISITIEATAASGALAISVVDLRTAASGGGSSVLSSPMTLSSLTAANTYQMANDSAISNTVQTSGSLILRQTTASLNSGTFGGVLIIQPVP